MTKHKHSVRRLIIALVLGVVFLAGAAIAILNWSVARSYNATAALLRDDLIAASATNPNFDSLQKSQSQVTQQLKSESSTHFIQFPRVRKTIAQGQRINDDLNKKIAQMKAAADARLNQLTKQAEKNKQNQSQSTDTKNAEAQRTAESNDQSKLNSLLNENTVNNSSTADSTTATSNSSSNATGPW